MLPRSPSLARSVRISVELLCNTCKTEDMGRFASTVEFYARYREPYPPEFFKQAAQQIALRGDETLLDVGCGPGLLAIGFAPFLGRCTGLDPEADMIAAAKAAAAETGVELSLIHGRIEEFPTFQTYDVVTLGRALHLIERNAALSVLERIVPDSGSILICGVRNNPFQIRTKPHYVLSNEVRGQERRHRRLGGGEFLDPTVNKGKLDACFRRRSLCCRNHAGSGSIPVQRPKKGQSR